MTTAYFVSSRTCNSSKDSKFLLNEQNLEEMEEGFSIECSDEYFVETAKPIISSLNLSSMELSSLELDEGELDFLSSLTGNDMLTINDLQEANETHPDLLNKIGIIRPSAKEFRKVYRLKDSKGWHLYGVDEINKNDNKNGIEKIRPRWCDLLINYILTKEENVENIHLFLHDKDIAGHDRFSAQLIDGVNECTKNNLISDDTARKLKMKQLTIVFFKHVNSSCIMDIIGDSEKSYIDRINKLEEDFGNAIDFLRGISRLSKLAEQRKKELEQKQKQSTTKDM